MDRYYVIVSRECGPNASLAAKLASKRDGWLIVDSANNHSVHGKVASESLAREACKNMNAEAASSR